MPATCISGGLLATVALAPALLCAQTTVPAGSMPSANNHEKPSPAVQAAPTPPPPPDWPINSQPKPASVTWNKDALSIDAANSSLQQILTDVASATGASVDGVTKDQRIFGTFGPAPARDVLTQLLQGTGYNVVMVGDQGQGVPRQVILSARSTGKATQGVTRSAPEETEEDYAPEPQYEPPPQAQQPQPQPPSPGQFPMPPRPGFNPGANTQQPGQQQAQPGQQQPVQQPNQQQ
jgi:hypothetical protein